MTQLAPVDLVQSQTDGTVIIKSTLPGGLNDLLYTYIKFITIGITYKNVNFRLFKCQHLQYYDLRF